MNSTNRILVSILPGTVPEARKIAMNETNKNPSPYDSYGGQGQ
jgi:hypothetical protein